MYRLMTGISAVIRMFYMANPFDGLQYGALLQFATEPLFHLVTYTVVGLYYSMGEFPFWGSLLYLLFYWIHVGVVMSFKIFNWNMFGVVFITILYIGAHIFINSRKNRIRL